MNVTSERATTTLRLITEEKSFLSSTLKRCIMYERIEINPFLYGSFQSILYYSANKFLDNVFPQLAERYGNASSMKRRDRRRARPNRIRRRSKVEYLDGYPLRKIAWKSWYRRASQKPDPFPKLRGGIRITIEGYSRRCLKVLLP